MKNRFLTYGVYFALIGSGLNHANAQQTLKVGSNPTVVTQSSVLDIEASNKGVLMPRVALTGVTDVITIGSPADALTVFNTATAGTAPDNVWPGYYYYSASSSKWIRLSSIIDGWSTSGNAGTTSANFIGTTDTQPLRFRLNNVNAGSISPVNSNTSIGYMALAGNTATDDLPTAINIPKVSGASTVQKNRAVAIGYMTMANVTDGRQSVAVGAFALGSAAGVPFSTTAIGYRSLYSLQAAVPGNTAIGWNTLSNSAGGSGNTAIGAGALSDGTENIGINVNNNVAVGAISLSSSLTKVDDNVMLGNLPLGSTGITSLDHSIILGHRTLENFSTPIVTNRFLVGMRNSEGLGIPTPILLDGDFVAKKLIVNNTLQVTDLNSSATATTGNRAVVADANGQLRIGTSSPDAWSTTGNTGTNPTNNFLGTTDAQPLILKTNNTQKLSITSDGYVGVGNITPQNKLHVVNSVPLGETVPNAIAVFESKTNTIGTTEESNAEIQVLGSNGSNNRGVTLGIGKPSIYGYHDIGYLTLGSSDAIWASALGVHKFSSQAGVTLNGPNYNGIEFYNHRSDNQDAYTFYSAVPTLNGTLMRIKAAATAGNGNLLSIEGGQAGANLVVDKNGKLGLGTPTPNSTLQVNGSVSAGIVGVTADYTLTDLDYTVVCRGTASITLTLPDPALCKGRIYVLINNSASSVATSRSFEVSSDSSGNPRYLSAIPIAGAAYGSITPHIGNKYTLQSDGSVWVMLSN